jgi:hypothetical protein
MCDFPGRMSSTSSPGIPDALLNTVAPGHSAGGSLLGGRGSSLSGCAGLGFRSWGGSGAV